MIFLHIHLNYGKIIYINDNGYYSSKFFDLLGFNSLSLINDKTACSYYITKYITKEIFTEYCGNSYFCSRGLKRAESDFLKNQYFDISKFNLPQYNIRDKIHFDKSQYCTFFKNDYCISFDFKPSTMDADLLQSLIYDVFN